MSVTLEYYLEDNNEMMDAGWTALRWFRASTPDGSFSQISSSALVADQLVYEYEDTSGGASSWYRVALFNSGDSSQSTLSDPFRPDVTTLLAVMLAAAEQAGAGFASVCTALGTETQLVDAALLDEAGGTDYQRGAWVYRPDAAADGDKQRRLAEAPFDTATGGLTPVRAWTNPPAEDEVYHLYLLLPPFKAPGAPYGWADAARDGLQMCYYPDRVDLGPGTGVFDDEFDLGPHLGYLRQGDVRQVWLERYNTDTGQVIERLNASKQGRYWKTQPNGRGSLKLIVRPAPLTSQHVIVELDRRDAELYAADDITSCPLRLAAAATVLAVYQHLTQAHPGKYNGELAAAAAAFRGEYLGEEPFAAVST